MKHFMRKLVSSMSVMTVFNTKCYAPYDDGDDFDEDQYDKEETEIWNEEAKIWDKEHGDD